MSSIAIPENKTIIRQLADDFFCENPLVFLYYYSFTIFRGLQVARNTIIQRKGTAVPAGGRR